MKRIIYTFLAIMIGMLGTAKAQTTVTAEALNSDEVQVTWGSDWSYIEDFETGDFSKFPWDKTISNFPWQFCTDNPYEGNYCIKAGNSGIDDSYSAIQVTLNIPFDGYISFYERVSSCPGFDCGRFFIDDVYMGLYSGESDWIKREYEVTQGTHTFLWSYTIETTEHQGEDCFWIDCIDFCHEAAPVTSTWLTYCTDTYVGNMGMPNQTVFAYYWPTDIMSDYDGYTVTKVGIYSDAGGYTIGDYTVTLSINEPGGFDPGVTLSTQTVTVTPGLGQFQEFECATPFVINGSDAIWMVWTSDNTASTMPAPYCQDMDYYMNGTLVNDGAGWLSLFNGDWMLEAYLVSPDGKEVKLGYSAKADIAYFNVYRKSGNGDPEPLVEQVTDTTYLDTDWATLEDGLYQWGISAIYDNDHETDIVWSAALQKNTTGLAETESATSVYPNPTQGSVTIEAEGMNHVMVMTLLGQVVYEAEASDHQAVIDLSGCKEGVYLVRVATPNGITTRRITLVK